MTQQRFVAMLSALALGLAGVVLLHPWKRFGSAPSPSALAFVPAGAAFVLDVDVARLRASAEGNALSRLSFQRLLPESASPAFHPLRDVDEVVLAVSGTVRVARGGTAPLEPSTVAIIAKGRFDGTAAADAAVAQIRVRGGEPVRTKLGTFESVRDLKADGEVAARNGLVVLSDGAYLRAVLAAVEGQRSDGTDAERMRDRVHAELRRKFGRGAPVTATLTLPEGTLEAALGDPEARRSPLALVRSGALRLNVRSTLDLDALFVCASADDGERVERFVTQARADLERALGSGALGRETTERNGERVELSLSLEMSDVERFLAPGDVRR